MWMVIAASFLIASPAWAEAQGAKAIFSSGEGPTVMVGSPGAPAPGDAARQPAKPKSRVAKKTEPKLEQYMGISYWVELMGDDGQRRRVTTDRVFRSGERIRLNLMSNRDGYLYLLNIGSTGQSNLLFPHPTIAGGNNLIKANVPYEIPVSGYIRFDENPGEESILVMLSPSLLPGFSPSFGPQMQALAKDQTDQFAMVAQAKGAKDLIVEVDAASPRPASYAVAPVTALERNGQMISLQLKLRHN